MKLAFVALTATLATASIASAMGGPYDSAADKMFAAKYATTGETRMIDVSKEAAGPASDWTASGKRSETVFHSNAAHVGHVGR